MSSDPLYTTPCPFDETERCYKINAYNCETPCGVIREKAQPTDKGESDEQAQN